MTAKGIERPSRWVGSLTPALAWLPGADLEVRAWTSQAERFVKVLGSASELVTLTRQLFDSYEIAEAVLGRPRTGTSGLDLATASDLESSFASEARVLAEATRLRDTRKPALLTGNLGAVMDSLQQVESQLIEAARVGEHASRLLAELTRIGEEAGPLLRQFSDSSAYETLTIDSLLATAASLDANLQFALVEANGLTRRLAGNTTTQFLDERLGVLNDVLTALLYMNRARLAESRLGSAGPDRIAEPRKGAVGKRRLFSRNTRSCRSGRYQNGGCTVATRQCRRDSCRHR